MGNIVLNYMFKKHECLIVEIDWWNESRRWRYAKAYNTRM